MGGFIDIVRYIYISVFKLHILLKKIITYNYTKHIVSRLMTILSSQNSLTYDLTSSKFVPMY